MAPEAVVEADGTLRRLDPETEGMELLFELLGKQGSFSAGRLKYVEEALKREAARSCVALPSELTLLRRHLTGPWRDPHRVDLRPVDWENAKERYGALLVLDKATSTRVSVLCTRQSVTTWRRVLLDFPTGEYRPEDRSIRRFESFQAHTVPIVQIAVIYQTVSLFLLLHYEDNAGLEARLPII